MSEEKKAEILTKGKVEDKYNIRYDIQIGSGATRCVRVYVCMCYVCMCVCDMHVTHYCSLPLTPPAVWYV
jgi:hypothetical protein